MAETISKQMIELEDKYGAHNYHPLPIVISKAEGVWVHTPEGKKYMDMLSAYSALNHGHRHPVIIKALKDQLDNVTLTSRAFYTDKLGPLYKDLADLTGMEMSLIMNTGAEAVETAIKMARKWGYEKKGVEENKAEIITCSNNFHGRTTTIVGFSTEDDYKKNFGPFTPGFVSSEYGNIDDLESKINKNTVAILFEPIQGEGGIIVPPNGYLKKMRELCDKHKILMMDDEIQTGLGRTGKLFCLDYENIKPDAYIVGKALGGGMYPVSAVISSKEILSVFTPGIHGSTFGGNPLGCTVASSALKVMKDEKLVEKSAEMGEYFVGELKNMNSPHVEEVRGRGLLIGVEIKKSSGVARPYCEKLMEKGILCKETHHQVIRFAPPLIISKENIDWAMKSVREVLKIRYIYN